jgi:hypothetical protein
MDATALPSASRLEPLRRSVLEYVQGLRLGLDLASEGALHHDQDKIEWGLEVLNKAPERRAQIQKLSRQLY